MEQLEATHIRPATPQDAAAICSIYQPIVRDTAISFETEPPDHAEIARRIRDTLPERPWLACQRGGALLGYAYAAPHRSRRAYQWSVEASVYIAEDARVGSSSCLFENSADKLRYVKSGSGGWKPRRGMCCVESRDEVRLIRRIEPERTAARCFATP